MDAYTIENLAVDTVREFAINTHKIKALLASEDKEAGYDGKLSIYNKEAKKKIDYIGSISVQIKRVERKQIGKPKIKRSNVRKSDLKMYLKDGGCYYFVIYLIVDENNQCIKKQLYGRQLHTLYIEKLLSRLKGKKSTTITMYEIKSHEDFYDRCSAYILEKKRQEGPSANLINHNYEEHFITTPDSFTVDERGFPLNEFYAHVKISDTDSLPNGTAELTKVTSNRQTTVYLNNEKKIRCKVIVELTPTETKVIFNHIFELRMNKNDSKAYYRHLPIRSIYTYENDSRVIDLINEGGKFNFDNIELEVSKNDVNVTEIRNIIEEVINMSKMYDTLFPENIELEFNNFKEEIKCFKWLLELFKEKKFEESDITSNAIHKFVVGEGYLTLLVTQDHLYNVFSEEFLENVIAYSEGLEVPPFYILTANEMKKSININFDFMKKSIDKYNENITEKTVLRAAAKAGNKFTLELISSHDSSGNKKFLEMANFVLDNSYCDDVDSKFINAINKAQIEVRIRGKVKEETVKELSCLRKKLEKINYEVASLYLNVILGSKQDAIMRYNDLPEDELESFNSLPILNLYKKLIGK